MASRMNNNRCKLLVLDLDVKNITIGDLRTFFVSYGPIEWIEIHPESTSAIIYFVSYLIVDHLVNIRRCLIGQNNVRLRRYRLDQNNWHIDSHTLYIKLTLPIYSNVNLLESDLYNCFQTFQGHIIKLDVIDDNQALVSFSNYDFVDQILLLPSSMFIMHDGCLTFERMMDKIRKKSRWDQTTPVENPVVHKLISHIEHLTKQMRGKTRRVFMNLEIETKMFSSERSSQSEDEINRLQAEVFILKNENSQLKTKHHPSFDKTIEQRLMALEDISNRLINKQTYPRQRERSHSPEKPSKRRRNYHIIED